MRSRPQLLLFVLSAFALRALIPIGFMPAADGTLSLMICPGGFPLELLPQEEPRSDGMDMGMGVGMGSTTDVGMPSPQPSHHRHGVMDDGFCAFTTGFSFAPPPLILAVLVMLLAIIAAIEMSMGEPAGICLVRLPQARAPPCPI
jgi:hypothetical protein